MILQCSPREGTAEPSVAQRRHITPSTCSEAPKWLLHPPSIQPAQKATIKQTKPTNHHALNPTHAYTDCRSPLANTTFLFIRGVDLAGCISEVLRCFILSVFSESLLRTVPQSSPQVEFHFYLLRTRLCVCMCVCVGVK